MSHKISNYFPSYQFKMRSKALLAHVCTCQSLAIANGQNTYITFPSTFFWHLFLSVFVSLKTEFNIIPGMPPVLVNLDTMANLEPVTGEIFDIWRNKNSIYIIRYNHRNSNNLFLHLLIGSVTSLLNLMSVCWLVCLS